jgi:phosphoglycerol transferase
MSVYIGFFSILAFALVADYLMSGIPGKSGIYLRIYLVPLAVLAVGLADQIPRHLMPNRGAVETAYRQDQRFVQAIEASVTPHSMIFELPYAAFPGQVPSNTAMIGYDELKGYLHSSSLRWSGGAMIGRPDDLWIRHVSGEPADQMVAAIMAAGFAGIWIDRYGYADRGASIESQIQKVVGREPLVSENGRRSFFLLDRANLDSALTGPVRPFTRTTDVPYVTVSVGKGCGLLERTSQLTWHLCGSGGQIVISNESDRMVGVDLTAKIATGDHDLSWLSIVGPKLSRKLQVNDAGTAIQLHMLAGHGESIVQLQSDARPLLAGGDSRKAVFRLEDLTSTVTYTPGKAGQ